MIVRGKKKERIAMISKVVEVMPLSAIEGGNHCHWYWSTILQVFGSVVTSLGGSASARPITPKSSSRIVFSCMTFTSSMYE